jgi:hypothetical protein
VNAPADIEVHGRTREVARDVVLRPEPERLWASRHQRATPNTPASAGVQGLFNAGAGGAVAAAAHAPIARDPADVRGNTLYYAKGVFGNSYGYIWWIPLHNFVLRHFWQTLGAADTLAAMTLTLLLIGALLLLYGFLRALKEAQTATTNVRAAATAGGAPHAFRPSHGTTPLNAAPASLFGPLPADANGNGGVATTQASAAPAPPVVGNSSLGIYHRPGCDWVAKIAPRQRADFDSADAARAARFRPCRVCKP